MRKCGKCKHVDPGGNPLLQARHARWPVRLARPAPIMCDHALAKVATGNPSRHDIFTQMGVFDWAALARRGFDSAYTAALTVAQNTLGRMAKHPQGGLTAPTLMAVNFAMAVHEAQLNHRRTTLAALQAAVKEVWRVISQSDYRAKVAR